MSCNVVSAGRYFISGFLCIMTKVGDSWQKYPVNERALFMNVRNKHILFWTERYTVCSLGDFYLENICVEFLFQTAAHKNDKPKTPTMAISQPNNSKTEGTLFTPT